MAATSTTAEGGWEKVTAKKFFNGDDLFEYKLKNGLRVLLVPRHQAKVLTYQTWFDVGSINEKLDPKLKKTGLAHLFEHMMFRGSAKYPDGKFDELTARIGGDKQNATTYFYRTNYYESVPSSQLGTLMELESDRMRSLNLTKEMLDKEKGAVVGELRRHMDSPNGIAWDELMKLVYDTAPYRWTVLGSEEEIKGFTVEEAQYYYKTFYAPNNATLIIIGDTTEAELLPLVEKYYGDMKSAEIPRPEIPVEPPQKKERKFETTHPQATSQILVFAYRIPPVTAQESVPLSLLSAHLSRGMEAVLRKVLIDPGIAVSANAGASSRPDLFEFFVHLAEGHSAEEAIGILDKVVASLQKTKIGKEAFERALNQEKLNLYDDITNNSELGNWLGEYLMLCGDYMRGFGIIDGYKSITAADLQKVAKDFFKKENRSIVIVRPQKKEKA